MALSGIECPIMQWDGDNLKESWRRFKQHLELMFYGPLKPRSEAEKCSYLLIRVNWKGRDIFNTWDDISDDHKNKLRTYYERFEAHVNPKVNPVFARFKFHSRVQGEIHHRASHLSPKLRLQRPRRNDKGSHSVWH